MSSPLTPHPFNRLNSNIIKHDAVAVMRPFTEEDYVNHTGLGTSGEIKTVLAFGRACQSLTFMDSAKVLIKCCFGVLAGDPEELVELQNADAG